MPITQRPFGCALLQLLRGPVRRLRIGQSDAVADPVHMRIDRDHILPEGEAHHDIGAFATDAG